jgi:tetratricopeptide (TPR) repeat protein
LVAARPTERVEAYDLYLQGQNSFQQSNNESDIRASVTAFERAVGLDPDFAAPWARLVIARLRLRWFEFDQTPSNLRSAEEALERARPLQPEGLEVITAEGYYHYHGHLSYESALTAFERVLEQDPENAEALASVGYVLRRQGRLEEAASRLQAVVILEPRAPVYAREYALTLQSLGRTIEAWSASDRAIALNPLDPGTYRDRSTAPPEQATMPSFFLVN